MARVDIGEVVPIPTRSFCVTIKSVLLPVSVVVPIIKSGTVELNCPLMPSVAPGVDVPIPEVADTYSFVDVAPLLKVCAAVHVFALARLRPTDCAAVPV